MYTLLMELLVGYDPGMIGWDDKKAPILAQRLRALLKIVERKFDGLDEWTRPYVETDGIYEVVSIRNDSQ